MCGCLSHAPYWGPELAHNPGMCPDWELNQQLLSSQACTQSTELPQPGQLSLLFKETLPNSGEGNSSSKKMSNFMSLHCCRGYIQASNSVLSDPKACALNQMTTPISILRGSLLSPLRRYAAPVAPGSPSK